ncbi:unnamed protein product [Peronospora farinosa]|uniref:Poly(A) RNA polymerase mitochondrial-like central palm domain-containing protein n=1 Tax=Peronospora farinosa TaxID=134698 RepID=A0AAV0T5E4_9STRA|nr:unnamed protein product [Peronospora farinosa]CAI5715183.1 unnamed protein product [Peronospora farinosa]
MASDVEALTRALGELSVSLRRRRRSCQSNAEKYRVLKWLHSLKSEELASLCCVEDVAFVKTLLHMAARSRGNKPLIQEFQLLPQSISGSTVAQNKRSITKTPLKAAPREFVKRPLVKTIDGDVVTSFHTREYEECCLKLMKGMRVLNALQSCDTVALSMDFFRPVGKGCGTFAGDFFHLMNVISCGDFLMDCPSDTTLKHRIWAETKWLKEQGYYSLQALFVNQIELNIWASWKQHKKDVTTKIPLQGLASKTYLVHEWETANIDQKDAVLRVLRSKTIGHLRDLTEPVPVQAAGAAKFQAARLSLESLLCILTVHQQARQQANHGISVDTCFTCAFEEAVIYPQAAVIKLLLAEHLQEQCSLLLCERLTKEEEIAAASSMSVSVTFSDKVGTMDDGTKVKAKCANHSQRRRASRKRMLKLRRREGENRAILRERFSCVLRELREHCCRKQEEAMACVDKVQLDVIDTVVGGNQLISDGWSICTERCIKNNGRPRQKRKDKKTRKKAGTAKVAAGLGSSSMGEKTLLVTLPQPVKVLDKPHSRRPSGEDDASERSAATAGSDSSLSQRDKPLAGCDMESGSTHDDGPSLSFFSNVGSTGIPTSSISSASALPLPTFGSQQLYSSSATTPFYLSLTPRDPYEQSSPVSRRGIEDDDDSNRRNETCPAGSESTSHEVPVTSETSNFEWFMPSVFSFQASAQRKYSLTPGLDWHFNHWQFKAPDGNVLDKEASPSTTRGAGLDPSPPPSSSSSGSSASSRFANARISGLTKKYSLASFSEIDGMDSSRRGSANVDPDNPSLTVTSIRENGDGASVTVDSDNKSDFLYREGGFFDRQRALKRRRRPWPYSYAQEESDSADEHDSRKDGRSNMYGNLKRCIDASQKGDTWTDCVHCCKCACHHGTTARLRNKRMEYTEDSDADSGINNEINDCKDQHFTAPSSFSMKVFQNGLDVKVTMALERMTLLEEKLVETTKVMEEHTVSASSEIATLKQTMAMLTAQLHNTENDIQEFQLQQSVPANTSGLDDMSMGHVSSCNSPPAPFSPAPSSLNQQAESTQTTVPTFPEAYAPTNSVMGPFVSVPLSVLPPRSKLHWDLCEFAAQLQVDSDSRLPAQLAAQRLCMATVQSLWPRAQVRPYGSHVSRLVLPSSDVDLVICLPKVRRDAPADAAGMLEGRNAIKETWQQNLARKLKQEPWVVRDSVKTLPHAAVPIITLLTAPPYNVRLDISFEGPGHNGLATNEVVLALLHEFPPLAPMMLILKSFAIDRGLAVAYSGGLSSYALLLLVTRYLQEHSDTMPNGFANASRAVQHSLSTVQAGVADFGLMLMGFLDFYGNRFDPRTTGISVASRCFLNRESTFMAGPGTPGMGDPHHVPHQYQQQYAADDAAVDDRTSQYGYGQHWQVPAQPHMQTLPPHSEAASAQGSRRYGYRSSLDLPASRELDGMSAATGLLDYQQLQQQTYDPHKFDPVFIEDPLCPSNNVGRNCFRVMQIRRAFSAAHLALLTASRDPAVFADNRIGLVAGVALHPDNILRAILGAGAPVNAKPDAATSAAVGVNSYTGAEHPYAFHSYNQQQNQQRYGYHHHHHQPPQPSYDHTGVPPPRSMSAHRNEPTSRRHSESESEKLTTGSATSTASRNDRTRKGHMGSPGLIPQSDNGNDPSQVQVHLLRPVSTDHGRQPRRLASLKQINNQQTTNVLSRKNSERSLSFADVVRDGGGTNAASVTMSKTPLLAIARPPRFSRDDMALEESINERRETKDDSELK